MFEQGIPHDALLRPGRYIVGQEAVTVYEEPSNDSPIIVKLNKASVVETTASPDNMVRNWRSVRTLVGKPGFIKSSAVLTTIEALRQQRNDLQKAMIWGIRKLLMGALLATLGIAVAVVVLFRVLFRGEGVLYLYGLIAFGCGEFYWGFEQRANAAHAIRKFDEEFHQVLG